MGSKENFTGRYISPFYFWVRYCSQTGVSAKRTAKHWRDVRYRTALQKASTITGVGLYALWYKPRFYGACTC